jgi:hypothetical protein
VRWRSIWRALQIGTPAVARTASAARSLWAAIVLVLSLGGTLVGQLIFRDPVTGFGLGMLALLAVAAAAFGVAAVRLVEERERAETPVLLLEYDPADRTSHQEDWVDPAPRNWLGAERYRVRVTNTSATTIDAVTLSLVRFRPQGAPFLPMPLKVVGDDMGIRSVDVALHGGDHRYYEVAWAGFQRDGSIGEIVLAYALSGVPNQIPSSQRYELDLRVQGRDTPPTLATFEVWVESRRLKFAPAGQPAMAAATTVTTRESPLSVSIAPDEAYRIRGARRRD